MASQHRKDRALQIVETFASKNAPGWFTAFSRDEVALAIRHRVNDPSGVNQQRAGVCGPAAFMYVLLSDHPDMYAKLVTELYDKGETYSSEWPQISVGIWIRPGIHLKNYRPPNPFQPADWIAMASLRDSSNSFLDYGSPSDNVFAGGTYSPDIAHWLRRVGGYQQVVDRTAYYGGKEGLLHGAHAYFMQGYRVFLSIHSAILNDRNSTWSVWPNHWVVLESPIRIARETVELKVFTWAYVMKLGDRSQKFALSKQNFLDHFYGFVAARY